jgi:uncharacterized membrane protein YdjX (TVP38/TMEM64 family)|tara:strand:- start:331 stop:1050 length:720 start_codon:yes stop_codon:yes gene_type:complete
MEKSKKIKLFIGLFYIIAVCLFLYFLFSKFSFDEITSYEFIKNNRNYFYELRDTNIYNLALIFILFTIVWVFAAGFGSPLAIFAGFIFGKWFGTLFLIIGMTIGATCLYIFANFFFKELVQEKFLDKYKNLGEKFRKSEFIYLLIYRFVGGIPFGISNVLPCIFNVKSLNFASATFLGMLPQLFVVVSIGSGLEKIIDQNVETPSIIDLISSPDIYLPIIAFFILLVITITLRNIFYKK